MSSNAASVPAQSSVAPPVSSQAPVSSVAPPPTTTTVESSIPPTTTTFSADPTTSTQISTRVITQSAQTTVRSQAPETVVQTSTREGTTYVNTVTQTYSTGTGAAASSSAAAAIENGSGGSSSGGGGLSTGAITAIAVVIPVAAVAILVFLGILFWRRRKSKADEAEERKREVEEYNYNPNGDPTLPAVGSESGAQMTQDSSSGYRGWGAATAIGSSTTRKASTTLSGGHTQQMSDAGNSWNNPSSPGYSDGNSSEPMVNHQRDTMNSDDLGALGVAPAASGRNGGLKRGPSNASSAYSAGDRSEHSDGAPPMPGPPVGQAYDYNPGNGYGYGQHGPYGDGTYGGHQDGMPVVQNLNARRNTRINPGGAYQQGNSGIAQNF